MTNNNNTLENMMIVQKFSFTNNDQNSRPQSRINTPKIQLKPPSTPQRRLSIKPNDSSTRLKPLVDRTNTIPRSGLSRKYQTTISPIIQSATENKQQLRLRKLNNEKSESLNNTISSTRDAMNDTISSNRDGMNDTITSEFGTISTTRDAMNDTISTNRDAMNDTITSEFGTMRSDRSTMTTITELNLTDKDKKVIENQATLDLLTKIRHAPRAVSIGPMPLSPQACRFELPFDLKLLETLTPLDYLSKYCRLSSRRQYQFKRLFDKYRNRRYRFESSSLYLSIIDIHKENCTHTKFDYLCQLIGLDKQPYEFTFETYAGILAVCERILYNSSTLQYGYDDYQLTKDVLEKCDFDCLDRKFEGLAISDTMKRLLNAL